MRPDPWKQERSRLYQKKQKAKGAAPPKKDDAGKKEVSSKTGGFTFVQPVAPQAAAGQDGSSEGEFDEQEYDVMRVEDLASIQIDLKDLAIAGLEDELLPTPADLAQLDLDPDMVLSDLDDMPLWLQEAVAENAALLHVPWIDVTPETSKRPSGRAPVEEVVVPARPRVDPLEDLLDGLLDA